MPKLKQNKSKTYWLKRAELDRNKAEQVGKNTIAELNRIYRANLKEIQAEMQEFFKKYGIESFAELDFAKTKALKKQLANAVKRYPKNIQLKRLYKATLKSAKFQRLQELEISLQTRLAKITELQVTATKESLEDTGKLSRALASATYKEALGVRLGTISDDLITKMVNSQWIGKGNFSAKIWADSSKVGEKLTDVFEKGLVQGTSLQKMSKELAEKTLEDTQLSLFQSTKDLYREQFNNSFRVIRTESTRIHNEVELDAIKDSGLQQYEYIAFLDNRTSEICEELDGKVFKVDEAEIGINMPPMHPSCRSTIMPYFD